MATQKSGHEFVNTYKAPLGTGLVISQDRPGEKIARAITEIQEVIENMEGTDGKGESIAEQTKEPGVGPLPATAETWQVLTWDGTEWVADWTRWV